jgi:hypothetical protein
MFSEKKEYLKTPMEIDLFGDRATDDRKLLICILETSFGLCEENELTAVFEVGLPQNV